MPTKVETQTFIRKHKPLLKVKLTGSSVSELNKLVDNAIDKLDSKNKDVILEWRKMKLKYDSSPQESEELSKSMKKTKLMKGGDDPVMKKKPKARITVSAKNFTASTKLGKSLPKNKSGFMNVKSVKKSTTIQGNQSAKTY
tara:strand:- start:341 stop:763 length:423 start_codon:yes stop_codon:yes gene_type:complete